MGWSCLEQLLSWSPEDHILGLVVPCRQYHSVFGSLKKTWEWLVSGDKMPR